jgi:hypothetical protein
MELFNKTPTVLIFSALSVFVGDFVQVTAHPRAQAYARVWFRV